MNSRLPRFVIVLLTGLCLGSLASKAIAQTWTQIAVTGPSLYTSVSAYDPVSNRMIVFGGEQAPVLAFGPLSNDVWVLTNANGLGGPATWIQLAPIGGAPVPRYGRSIAYDPASNRMIVFSGIGDPNDTWVLTNANGLGGAPEWIQTSAAGGPSRFGAGAAYDLASNRVILYGGSDSACYFCYDHASTDIFVLTNANGLGGTPIWTQLAPVGGPPAPRLYHYAVYDPKGNRLIVYGGSQPNQFLTDTWALTNANGVGGTPAWIEVSPEGGPERFLASAVFDPSTNQMIVFGGEQSLCFAGCTTTNETWALINANGLGGAAFWIQRNIAGILPPDRSGHTAIYDPAANRMTIHAGFGSLGFTPSSWVLSNANGTFNTGAPPAVSFLRSDIAVGATPGSLVATDLNNDGRMDLVAHNTDSNSVSVLLGAGDGTFSRSDFAAGDVPLGVAAGDFNRDGNPDVVVSDFGPPAALSILLGNGDGTLQPPNTFSTGSTPENLIARDFDRGGTLDLATTNGASATISILLGNGDGTFGPAVDFPSGGISRFLTADDLDGDGNLDLVVSNNPGSRLSVLLGNGDGTFGPNVQYTTASFGSRQPSSGDFDRDGKVDVAIANLQSNTVSALPGNGDGTLGSSLDFSTAGFGTRGLTRGDFNGDALLDLALTDVFSNSASILVGNGNGTFTSAISFETGVSPFMVVATDFNRDGKPDLAVPNADSNSVTVLVNNSSLAINTSSGGAATVQPFDSSTGTAPATLQFDNVTEDGSTTLTTTSSGPAPPSGFSLGDPPIYYEISTTAVFSGNITVCIHYDEATVGDETQLKLFHLESGSWVDRTAAGSPDTTNNIICASVSSLSPFVVLEALTVPIGLAAPLAGLVPHGETPPLPSHAFKGGSTLPLKLEIVRGGVVLTAADVAAPHIVALVRSGDVIDLTTIDPDAGQANDSGLLFRFADGQWVYNLSTAGLSTGTYTITIEMPDGRRFDAAFVLR